MKRRGTSIVEVMVACLVSLLIVTAVLELFIHGGYLYMRGQTRADLQANGLVALNELSGELRRTALSTLTITTTAGSTPTGLAFRVEDPPHPGQPAVFTPNASFVLYFVDASRHELVRKTWPFGGGDTRILPDPIAANRRLSAAEIGQICSTTNHSERVLASNVASLETTPATYPTPTPINDLAVTLHMSESVSSTEVYQDTVTVTIGTRNQ